MLKLIVSTLAALRASRFLGRASRVDKNSRGDFALELARAGLNVLKGPYVNRAGALEGAALLSLTILAETLAERLDQPGVERVDLEDSLKAMKEVEKSNADVRVWIPYLEARLSDCK